ncbi:MAG: hypothetical protein HPY83_11050 [Anaerolineae bacterium]|nr:hypothetical protein [Anaerolineae bacterium]
MSRTGTVPELLALGALDAGVRLAAGYPGAPVTGVMETLARLTGEEVVVEWATNERSAFDAAFGASLAGVPSLVCLKGVGLNVALDSLMAANLAGGPGGFVVLVGDDPGAWGSQNEQDSRLLAAAAEVPLLEATGAASCAAAMAHAFDLSRRHAVPVLVRLTSSLALESGPPPAANRPEVRVRVDFRREPGRYTVLPATVVAYHRRLHRTLAAIGREFERSSLNRRRGEGEAGVVAAGNAAAKLERYLRAAGGPPLQVLTLGTLLPLPEETLAGFLAAVARALVVEETLPYLEERLLALSRRRGLTLPVLGRLTGHIPSAGEITEGDIGRALAALLPGHLWPAVEAPTRHLPSQESLCPDCPYVPAFLELLAAFEARGGREAFVVTGEPGCMVRALLPPFELLDVKYAMGSSIGLAAGLARAQREKKVVSLAGDSALLHTGLQELIDAAQADAPLMVMVLDNATVALTGGQPHAASGRDLRGQPRRPVDLERLVRACGVERVWVADPRRRGAFRVALAQSLDAEGLRVVIARAPCPRGG